VSPAPVRGVGGAVFTHAGRGSGASSESNSPTDRASAQYVAPHGSLVKSTTVAAAGRVLIRSLRKGAVGNHTKQCEDLTCDLG
jgi:hypothetical protein